MNRPALPFPALLAATAAALLAACASSPMPEHVGPPAREQIVALSASHQLLRFNAGQPQNLRDRRPLAGLPAGERLVGIDFRVAHGQLYALGASGQLYRIDVAQARAAAVGTPVALPAGGREWGFDFNPTVDRIRVVADTGANLRLHPETGALVATDPALAYDTADAAAGKAPRIVAAAYTYHPTNDKLTTNFALDGATGTLVHQGTREGVAPAVSPNTGRLYTVGSLGIGPFDHAVFDIADVGNEAYAGVHARGAKATRWHRLDLATGRAVFLGTVGGGEPLIGAAIEP